MTTDMNRRGSDWPLEGWDPNVRCPSYRYMTLIKVKSVIRQRANGHTHTKNTQNKKNGVYKVFLSFH